MDAERLLRLASHLDTVAPELFDMAYWGQERPGCGTVCCAVGHACTIPEFASAGLALEWPALQTPARTMIAHPVFGSRDGVDAVAKFFGIWKADVEHLFTNEAYWDDLEWKPDDDLRRVEAADVAARIRAFVAP